MTKKEVINRILGEKVFAVLRLKHTAKIEEVVGAIVRGGISIIEVTLNTKNAIEAMHTIRNNFPECMIGAGTVIGYDATVKAVENGAKFLVSPVTDLDMLAVCTQVGVTSMAGALTPTEAWQASLAGADFVKLFPLVGLGPQYIKALRGPLDRIRFIPTNGVTPSNIGEYLDAGAVAAGLGSSLVTDEDVEQGRFEAIEERARMAVEAVKTFSKTSVG